MEEGQLEKAVEDLLENLKWVTTHLETFISDRQAMTWEDEMILDNAAAAIKRWDTHGDWHSSFAPKEAVK